MFEEALLLARELGDHETIAIGLAIARAIGSARGVQNVLEVAAGLAVLCGDWRRAARLFGTVEAQLAQMGLRRTPEDDAALIRCIAIARETLGEALFAAEETAGRALSYDVAIDDAREWLEHPQPAR